MLKPITRHELIHERNAEANGLPVKNQRLALPGRRASSDSFRPSTGPGKRDWQHTALPRRNNCASSPLNAPQHARKRLFRLECDFTFHHRQKYSNQLFSFENKIWLNMSYDLNEFLKRSQRLFQLHLIERVFVTVRKRTLLVQ